jgi:glycosyltransferase involved in cell wall biosynthesis
MRIAVDGRHLAAGRGVARYSHRLLEAMAKLAPGDEWLIVRGTRTVFAAGALTGRPRLDRLAGGADVVWAPAPAPLAVSADIPLVVTVHDLSWVERFADFTAYERLWHRLARIRALVDRADRVIAVSAATRAALVAWGIAESKITVVRSGPGIGAPPEGVRRRVDPPYFLAVGALEPRKATGLLARAYARARDQGLRAELVFAGEGRVTVSGEGVRALGTQDDAALRALYAQAIAVVHPALLEGFGFPPIEGLAHGVPAIVADLPVYEETIGGGALRVPPGDEEALAAALLRVEREPALRDELVAAGRAAIASLSWEQAARETHAILAEAARG